MKLRNERIAEARGEMTRAALARAISRRDSLLDATSALHIRRWEEGRHRMRYESETITAIAAVTGKPIEFFYDEQNNSLAAASAAVIEAAREAEAAWSRMPDAGLTADDPRRAWWFETAAIRGALREALRAYDAARD